MDITPFLRELLFGHDCVIVPGFGGFVGNYSPAHIDKSDYTFYPPVKQISFNRNLNHNDGLLIGKISESLKLNYGDARNIIDEYVQSVKKKLDRGEKILFDKIGYFSLNHEGSLQFEPDPTVNYHLGSYGLDTFQFQPLEGYDIRKKISQHIDKESITKRPVRKILWRAAVIIPFIGILVAVSFQTDLFKARVEKSTFNPLASAEFEENRQALEESVRPLPVTVDEASLSSVSAPVTELNSLTTNASYCIITGSFKSRENASVQMKMLEKEGFTPEILNAPNGFFRVSAARCPDLSTALSKKDSVIGKFPGSWVNKI